MTASEIRTPGMGLSPEGDKLTPQAQDMAVNLPKFSLYRKPITNTRPHRAISLPELYHLLTFPYFAEATDMLRTITDADAAKRYKAKAFNYVTPSGTFSERKGAALIQHSGYLVIDFDHVADLEFVKEVIKADKHTELVFTSPSGTGLKWIVAVDLREATHQDYFDAIRQYGREHFGIDADRSGRNIDRACFLCYDPQAYIHPKYLPHVPKDMP